MPAIATSSHDSKVKIWNQDTGGKEPVVSGSPKIHEVLKLSFHCTPYTKPHVSCHWLIPWWLRGNAKMPVFFWLAWLEVITMHPLVP
jgi:WD40 repeat protein